MATKTSFPVTENMIEQWADNLENQPFHLDMETGETRPITASRPHGCLARFSSARSYNPGPAMPTADMSASQVNAL